ncbi:hypothetical protein BDR05DRAFT_733256 [Suillus weaverae]|nr:hypothetical protein BDR05DRAFT_733256 [Suillus weaverae]
MYCSQLLSIEFFEICTVRTSGYFFPSSSHRLPSFREDDHSHFFPLESTFLQGYAKVRMIDNAFTLRHHDSGSHMHPLAIASNFVYELHKRLSTTCLSTAKNNTTPTLRESYIYQHICLPSTITTPRRISVRLNYPLIMHEVCS